MISISVPSRRRVSYPLKGTSIQLHATCNQISCNKISAHYLKSATLDKVRNYQGFSSYYIIIVSYTKQKQTTSFCHVYSLRPLFTDTKQHSWLYRRR